VTRHRLALGVLLVFGWGCLAAAGPASAAPSGGPEQAEIRGVWAHPGFFGSDETAARAKIAATLDGYVRAGLNTVIILVKNTTGHVYFKSDIGVADPAWSWDFFGVFLQEARDRGLAVHPWFCVFPESAVLGQVRQHPEWLIRGPKGEMVGAVNAALPEVRAYELSLMMELVRRYPVDWIHLDYIRFPCDPAEPYFSFDAKTRALFQAETGQDPSAIKARDSGNIMWNEWIEWNAGHVTRFVRELRAALRDAGRPVKISAAVFPAADKAKVLIGQDWESWARQGLIDMLCPMLYVNGASLFEKYAHRAMDIGAGRVPVCPGIGLGTSHNQNTPEGMLGQIETSRRLGGAGFILFSSSSLTEPFLAALGATAAPAGRQIRK
jgi:uncharacterized lipoprotein YddW (UPF0748 family)